MHLHRAGPGAPGPLTIAVSTGGASPALARRVREELEERFGPGYGRFLRALQAVRARVLARRRAHPDNPRLFQRLVAGPLEEALARRTGPGPWQPWKRPWAASWPRKNWPPPWTKPGRKERKVSLGEGAKGQRALTPPQAPTPNPLSFVDFSQGRGRCPGSAKTQKGWEGGAGGGQGAAAPRPSPCLTLHKNRAVDGQYFFLPDMLAYYSASALFRLFPGPAGVFLPPRARVLAVGLGFHTAALALVTMTTGKAAGSHPGGGAPGFFLDPGPGVSPAFLALPHPGAGGPGHAPGGPYAVGGAHCAHGQKRRLAAVKKLLGHAARRPYLPGAAALSLAGLGGLFYLVQERQIKRKSSVFSTGACRPWTVGQLSYWCLSVGFPLLTAGMVIGSLYAQYTLGRFFSFDPKEILTLIAWLIYAVLLHERLTVGWRGRRAAILALCGLSVLIITFLGGLWLGGYHSFASFSGKP